MSEEERRSLAVPVALTGIYDGIDLSLLNGDDEDDRRILIEAEHPELHAALRSGQREIHRAGTTMNPTLHITMHEIVANQLWADDPPEMWETAQRLLKAGYDRHEVLHMLASVVSNEVFQMLRHHEPHELERVRQALAALPASWDRQRGAIGQERHMNRADRRAAARRRPR